jgi:hypothetical protein
MPMNRELTPCPTSTKPGIVGKTMCERTEPSLPASGEPFTGPYASYPCGNEGVTPQAETPPPRSRQDEVLARAMALAELRKLRADAINVKRKFMADASEKIKKLDTSIQQQQKDLDFIAMGGAFQPGLL